MPDQITFNNGLTVLGGTPATTNLTGTVSIDYDAHTISGSLKLSAAGALGAQAYNNLSYTQSGTTVGGVPTYRLTASNGNTSIAIDYTGQLPTAAKANVMDSGRQTDLASGTGAVTAVVVCFAAGTLIRTSRGDVPVETLRIGEIVLTTSGKSRRITWVGSRKLDCRKCAEPRAVFPIKIAAEAFGEGAPFRDLLVSPGHTICARVLDEILVPATVLVNGTTVTQVEVDEITYWHVELDTHDIIFANGLPTESYINVRNRTNKDDTGGVDPTRAPLALADYCRPYVASGLCVRALRERLQARAETFGWHLNTAPLADFHLSVDGKRIEPDVDGLTVRFRFPAEAADVWLVSETAVASYLFDTPDERRLGVCLRNLSIKDRNRTRNVDLDDALLSSGFHALEAFGEAPQRWTTGRARLPAALWRDLSGELQLDVELATPALPRWRPPTEPGTPEVDGPKSSPMVKDAA